MRSTLLILATSLVICLPFIQARSLQKRAAFYIANETACVVDSIVYYNGDPIPTDDPCEACKCRPPGFACVLRECEVKPGCRAVRKAGHCCPEYICGCEHNGRMFRDGDEISDSHNPCYTCHCQGSAIACAFVDCFFRVDCAPDYIAGECCPSYAHCSELAPPVNESSPKETPSRAHSTSTISPTDYDILRITGKTIEIFTDSPVSSSSEIPVDNKVEDIEGEKSSHDPDSPQSGTEIAEAQADDLKPTTEAVLALDSDGHKPGYHLDTDLPVFYIPKEETATPVDEEKTVEESSKDSIESEPLPEENQDLSKTDDATTTIASKLSSELLSYLNDDDDVKPPEEPLPIKVSDDKIDGTIPDEIHDAQDDGHGSSDLKEETEPEKELSTVSSDLNKVPIVSESTDAYPSTIKPIPLYLNVELPSTFVEENEKLSENNETKVSKEEGILEETVSAIENESKITDDVKPDASASETDSSISLPDTDQSKPEAETTTDENRRVAKQNENKELSKDAPTITEPSVPSIPESNVNDVTTQTDREPEEKTATTQSLTTGESTRIDTTPIVTEEKKLSADGKSETIITSESTKSEVSISDNASSQVTKLVETVEEVNATEKFEKGSVTSETPKDETLDAGAGEVITEETGIKDEKSATSEAGFTQKE